MRAMFDRIAGVYDRMNTVMTAGLHHRWRGRAADLAALDPGDRALDVATGTGDLAIELARGSARRGGGRRRLLRADAELARGKAVPAPDLRSASRRQRAGAPVSPTTRSMPPRSASAPATSPTSIGGCARWRGSCARAAGSSCSRSRPRAAAAVDLLRAWFDRVVPALGRLAGDSQAYSYLQLRQARFPVRGSSLR